VVPIELDPKVEVPEERSGFAHPDLLPWTRERRADLLVDALTVLRAYHLAGRPAHGKPRKGSFEAWDDLVRGACVWVQLGDPLAGTERVRREADSDLMALGAALDLWRAKWGDVARTAAEAVAEAGCDAGLRDALHALAEGNQLESRRLGYALRRVRGRRVGGLRFEPDGERGHVVRWTVVES
jgi:putative DNA primase/helicase